MLFGKLANDYVGQPCGEGCGNNEGNGTEFHAGETLYSPRYLRRQGVGHVAQEVRFGREEVLIHIEAAALSAESNQIPFKKRHVLDEGYKVSYSANLYSYFCLRHPSRTRYRG